MNNEYDANRALSQARKIGLPQNHDDITYSSQIKTGWGGWIWYIYCAISTVGIIWFS